MWILKLQWKIKTYGLTSLEERRDTGDVIEAYKIIHAVIKSIVGYSSALQLTVELGGTNLNWIKQGVD